MTAWLAALVCFLFLVEAAWRFEYMAKSASSEYEKGDALFNGVNFLLLALVGAACVIRPHFQAWCESNKRRGQAIPAPRQAKVASVVKGVVVIVDSSNIRS